MQFGPKTDKVRFKELVDLHYANLVKVCNMLVREMHVRQVSGEEIAHEILYMIRKHPEKLIGHADQKAWLYKVAYNYCRNERRKQFIRDFHSAFSLDEVSFDMAAESEEESAISDEVWEAIYEVVRTLSAREQLLFTQLYEQKKTVKQLAVHYNCKEAAMNKRALRLQTKIAKQVKKILKLS